ncbi:dimethyl sulfoxide reductase anchor subunit family protein [Agrilutibacter solisilvae]|uniref:Dimethyl sulfoxide reductase anchor subunit n=1 Tax=Agrilutibacter solisilvae TaxID=2763317 RepID=A0A974XZR6_9GAMM|nr:DmsC/YnfH family molybdoenzyme membrane anchor subunit [Lysobacter solisilvae]QSX78776.1 dimethyl sulfoxide reductase anchor subunit [Lysobacter solisilvae]
MHPAFSVIFFTTLSGAGYGLLLWSAVAALLGWSRPSTLLIGIVLGLVLSTIGLLSSVAHLGKPGRAWRAFSQWRTSWLSREGVAALVTCLPALVLGVLLLGPSLAAHPVTPAASASLARMIASALLIACALATVYCTAMIYASLRPIPAWCHRLVAPVYLLFSLLTGGLLFGALVATVDGGIDNRAAMPGLVAAIVLAALKWKYWGDVDAPLPLDRGAAVGLPGREVSVFERPHTQANYLTREMGFVVARKHGRVLRAIAMVLFTVLPVLALLPVALVVHLDAAPWLWVAALGALTGAFVERWLFFAQAKHMVTLYY